MVSQGNVPMFESNQVQYLRDFHETYDRENFPILKSLSRRGDKYFHRHF